MRHPKARLYRNCAISLIAALTAFVAACPKAGMRTADGIHLSEYIEMFIPHAGTGEPEFPAVLDVVPVEMDMKLQTAYHPDRAFKGKFVQELRDGAITYLDRKGMFIAVRESGGEFSLKMRVISYEASRKSNPQKVLLMLETSLNDVRNNRTILFGKAGSQLIIPINQLNKIITITPPGGGKGVAITRGTLEIAQLCTRIFQNIENEIRKNKNHILKSLQL